MRASRSLDLGFFRDRQFSGAVVHDCGDVLHLRRLHLLRERAVTCRTAAATRRSRPGFLDACRPPSGADRGPLSGCLVGTRGPRGVLVAGMLVMGLGAGGRWPSCRATSRIGWLLVGLHSCSASATPSLSAPVSTVAVCSMPREPGRRRRGGGRERAQRRHRPRHRRCSARSIHGASPSCSMLRVEASDVALADFRQNDVDALYTAYAVPRKWRRRARGGPTMRATPAGASVDAVPVAEICDANVARPQRAPDGYVARGIRRSPDRNFAREANRSCGSQVRDDGSDRAGGAGPPAARQCGARSRGRVREDEYERLLRGLCAFPRGARRAARGSDGAGDAEHHRPPPSLADSGVDALFDGRGLSADQPRRRRSAGSAAS